MKDTGKSYKDFLWRLLHVGPIATLILIKTITLSVIYCSLMWWSPIESIGGLVSLTIFLMSSGMVMFNFFSAIYNGPGFLPHGWTPNNEAAKSKLQYCHVCKGFKAPRAHHCRKCGHCVMKLDHHCPWINSCVGHHNHAHFVAFLISACIGCSHAVVVLACSIYHAIFRNEYLFHGRIDVPYVYLGLYGLLWCLFSCGCAFGVVLGVAVLLYYQMKVVLYNETTIEEWIMEKAKYRRQIYTHLDEFKNPYDLGWKKNFEFVMNWSCTPIGNGVDWPLAEGSDPYSMTVEQIQQKNDKRRRTKECIAVEEFSGSWCPISKGIGVLCHPPFSDEPRIKIRKDERLMITRWKNYWVYGQKLLEPVKNFESGEPSLPLIKGWLPRRCIVEVIDSSCSCGCHDEKQDNPPDDKKPDNGDDVNISKKND